MFDLGVVYPHLACWNDRMLYCRVVGDDSEDELNASRGLGLKYRSWKGEASFRIVTSKGFYVSEFSDMFDIASDQEDTTLLYQRYVCSIWIVEIRLDFLFLKVYNFFMFVADFVSFDACLSVKTIASVSNSLPYQA